MDVGNIFEGLHGPGKFRFFMQPLMAIFLGIRDGKIDAEFRRPPYFLNLLKSSHQRTFLVKNGFTSIMKPFILAWMMDTAFQIFVLGSWSPFQATIVGILLIALPYIIVRGVTNRTMKGIEHYEP
jgi:hypothetical protein